MATTNFTSQTITQQLAQRSGQISVAQNNGGWQFVDDLTGKSIDALPASSSLLANPQRVNDPKIKSRALDAARGYYSRSNVPPEMVEAIASVAAYVSAVRGVSVSTLLTNDSISLELIQAYNSFKPKGSQVGVLQSVRVPSWTNNPTLRGSISAAITDEP